MHACMQLDCVKYKQFSGDHELAEQPAILADILYSIDNCNSYWYPIVISNW